MSALIALSLTATLSNPAAVPPVAPVVAALEAGRPGLAVQAAALADAAVPAVPAAGRPARMPPGGDSLKNGAVIGGVVAAVAAGSFLYTLCHAMDDTGGDADCARPSLIFAGVAGAGGAAVGAGIDALFARAPSLRMRVRF
ncbi:MAG TPA: hypothetical protein VFZ36_11095 [Vicinamibacterales bacterium]